MPGIKESFKFYPAHIFSSSRTIKSADRNIFQITAIKSSVQSIDSVEEDGALLRNNFQKVFFKNKWYTKDIRIQIFCNSKKLLTLMSMMLHSCSPVKVQSRRALSERKSILKFLWCEGEKYFNEWEMGQIISERTK